MTIFSKMLNLNSLFLGSALSFLGCAVTSNQSKTNPPPKKGIYAQYICKSFDTTNVAVLELYQNYSFKLMHQQTNEIYETTTGKYRIAGDSVKLFVGFRRGLFLNHNFLVFLETEPKAISFNKGVNTFTLEFSSFKFDKDSIFTFHKIDCLPNSFLATDFLYDSTFSQKVNSYCNKNSKRP